MAVEEKEMSSTSFSCMLALLKKNQYGPFQVTSESQLPFLNYLVFIEEFLLDRLARVKWQLMKLLLND